MISSTVTIRSITLGYFMTFFIVISLDGIFCLSTTYVEEGTGSRLPCKHDVPDNEFRRVRWFKSIQDDVYENGDPAVVSWDGASPPYTTDNYDIEKDLSLIIYNTSIPEEGIYRCYVTRNIPGDFVYYDMKIIAYGKIKPFHTSPVEYGTHLRIPCSSNSTGDIKVAVLWYKRNSTGILNSNDQPIASWIDGKRDVSADYTLNDDFSLEIQNVSIEYEAVYRSIVVFTKETRPSASDANVTVYALPREVPLMWNSVQKYSTFINCSVDHVYPLLFPEFNFLSNNQIYGIQNEDGTFNTSINVNVIHSGHNITLECSFPYFNYTGKSSLFIPANITDEDEELLPTDSSACTCPTYASTIGIAFGVVLLGIVLITVAVVVRKRYSNQHKQKNDKISPPEMECMV